jgi:magnesium-transporting ATPase (P-type)
MTQVHPVVEHPAVVTVALSLGVFRMARRGALVRKLAAVSNPRLALMIVEGFGPPRWLAH